MLSDRVSTRKILLCHLFQKKLQTADSTRTESEFRDSIGVKNRNRGQRNRQSPCGLTNKTVWKLKRPKQTRRTRANAQLVYEIKV